MKFCIGFGKSSKYIYYLLICIISNILCDFLLGFNNNNKNKKIKFFNFIPVLKDHYIIRELIVYMSAIVCGILFYLFKDMKEMKKKGEITIRKQQRLKKEIFKEKGSITFIIIFISLIYCINNVIRTFLYSAIYYVEFWMLEIAFIVIISSIVFKTKIGNHKKVAVFIISGVLFILRIINCILPRTNHNCESKKECQEKYLGDNNIFYVIKQKFGNLFYVPIIFVFYIIIAIMRDYSWVKTKYLLDIKSVHFFKIFIYLGAIGSTLIIIILVLLTKKPCEILKNVKQVYNNSTNSYSYINMTNEAYISFKTKICKFKLYDENKKELKLYYDSFNILFNGYKKFDKNIKIEVFVILPLLFALNIIINFSQLLLIKNFDPYMLLVCSNFYFFTQRLIEFVVNRGEEKYLTKIQFILYEVEELVSIFANLIYMEIIELRFCNFDYDTKNQIQLRADLELQINDDDDPRNYSKESESLNISLSEI